MLESSINANVRSALHDRDASISAAHQTGGFSGWWRTAGTGNATTSAVVDGDGILSIMCICVLATCFFNAFPLQRHEEGPKHSY